MSSHTIVTPTPDLEQSIRFYDRLKFHVEREEHSATVQTKDLRILIDANRYTRAGVRLSRDDWQEQVDSLRKRTNVVSIDGGFHFNDPNGVRITLGYEGTHEVKDMSNELPPSTLGNYAGISIESTDMQASVEFYAILGFKVAMGSAEKGWLSLQNEDDLSISIMKSNSCPHLFFNPSLTFFNGKNNMKVIQDIRSAGISITEEITYFNKEGIVDNIIIRDPGGYGFFIFSD